MTGNALLEVEKKLKLINFNLPTLTRWQYWLHYHFSCTLSQFVCLHPTLSLSPPHSSNVLFLFFSHCVCAFDFSKVVVVVGHSFHCFGHGQEKCCRILVFIFTCSSCVVTLSVLNVTQSLWRRHIINTTRKCCPKQ